MTRSGEDIPERRRSRDRLPIILDINLNSATELVKLILPQDMLKRVIETECCQKNVPGQR